MVLSSDEESDRARPVATAQWVRQIVERLRCGSDSPEPWPGDLNQGRPPWWAGHLAAPYLLQRRVLDAALLPQAGPLQVTLGAFAAALVLGLVELPVDHVLKHDEQHADEDREDGDADVRLQVPPLHPQPRDKNQMPPPKPSTICLPPSQEHR